MAQPPVFALPSMACSGENCSCEKSAEARTNFSGAASSFSPPPGSGTAASVVGRGAGGEGSSLLSFASAPFSFNEALNSVRTKLP